MSDVVIRPALHAERSCLEALQWRASLANSGDRDALLANPDAISLPVEQIADGPRVRGGAQRRDRRLRRSPAAAGRECRARCAVRRAEPLETRRGTIARRTLRRCRARAW